MRRRNTAGSELCSAGLGWRHPVVEVLPLIALPRVSPNRHRSSGAATRNPPAPLHAVTREIEEGHPGRVAGGVAAPLVRRALEFFECARRRIGCQVRLGVALRLGRGEEEAERCEGHREVCLAGTTHSYTRKALSAAEASCCMPNVSERASAATREVRVSLTPAIRTCRPGARRAAPGCRRPGSQPSIHEVWEEPSRNCGVRACGRALLSGAQRL